MNNINLKLSGAEIADEYSEKEFHAEFVSKGFVILEDDRLQDFITDVNKMIAKGNASGLSNEQLDSIEKAKKDLTKLVRKIVVDKNGKKVTKWVKMDLASDDSKVDQEHFHHGALTRELAKPKHLQKESVIVFHTEKMRQAKTAKDFDKFMDDKDKHNAEDAEKQKKFWESKPSDKKVGVVPMKPNNGSVHGEAWERHQHNMKVQRQGKEAYLKHIESKYGADVAKHVRDKHEAPSKAAEKKVEPTDILANDPKAKGKGARYVKFTDKTGKEDVGVIIGTTPNGRWVVQSKNSKNTNDQIWDSQIISHATQDDYKKLSSAELMKPMEGKTYQVSQRGKKNEFILESTDGMHAVDMMWDNPEDAEQFASKRGFKLKKMAKKDDKADAGLTQSDYDKVKGKPEAVKFLSDLKAKYKGKKPTETFDSIYGTKVHVYGKEGNTYHVKYGDAESIIPHTESELNAARKPKK